MSREPSADSHLWGAGQDQHTLQIRRGAETDMDFLLSWLRILVRRVLQGRMLRRASGRC
jgi:hypothetical protein